MGYQDEISADIARLREIRAMGAAFTLRRVLAENQVLRQRLAALEASVVWASVPACAVDLVALSRAVRTLADELERVAPDVIRQSDGCEGRHLQAVQ